MSAALALGVLLAAVAVRPAAAADEADRRARVAATGRATDPALLARTLHSDADALVRAAAAETLGRLREAGAAAPLAEALGADADAGVRAEAARALAALARLSDARLFARAGLEYLPEDAHLRRDRTLPPEAVLALARAAGDPDRSVRAAAVRALGEVGPAAAPAREALATRLARDEDRAVRLLAAQALGRIGDPAAVDPLAGALGDPVREVRLAAARALARLAPPGPAAAPAPAPPASSARPTAPAAPPAGTDVPRAPEALVRAMHDRDGAVRAAAIEALVAWPPGGDPPALGPGLLAALDDPADLVRTAAADGLTTRAAEAAPRDRLPAAGLDQRIAREAAPASRAALHALAARLRPEAAGPHLDALVAALDDRAARRAAERGLVRLARAGLPAAEVLRARLGARFPGGGPDSAAARALARVEAGGPLVLPEARP